MSIPKKHRLSNFSCKYLIIKRKICSIYILYYIGHYFQSLRYDKISFTKKTTINTQAKATITLKKDQVREVIGLKTEETSQDETDIQSAETETWLNNIKRNGTSIFNN